MKHYRALISVPITVANDNAAYKKAFTYAAQLQHDNCVVGHVETLFEVEPDRMDPSRVLIINEWLYAQVPEHK
jgi:hypothetical protein